MKLTQDEVLLIVKKLLEEWKHESLISTETSDRDLLDHLSEIFVKELRVEDNLNQEVDQLLEKYDQQFESGALDRRKMFLMVKAQLVKEKGLVL